MPERLIIIGGVAAGTKAASKARREKPDLKITLYTNEKHISYSACGLPYYIGDVVKTEQRLLVRSPEAFKEKENIDIKLLHNVKKIDPDNNKVLVQNLETLEEFEDEYDNLLVATGSRSIIPPIERTGLNNVFTLKNVVDGMRIKNAIKSAKKAVIVGAGYIGLELAESFRERGINVTIIERDSQILAAFDSDLADQIQTYMEEEQGVNVITDETVTTLKGDENNNVISVETQSGNVIDADIVVIAVGVRPNVELTKDAGIELGETGAIKVNSKMQTNFPNIYAAGDCVESVNRITRKETWIPLGSTANKQGRVAAMNICGNHAEFEGILGSMVVKIFDYSASKTGLSEKEAKKQGYEYEIAVVPHRDRSGYMPGAENIIIKMIAEKGTGKIMGLQAIGKGDADKRVNIVAAALTAGMTVSEFMQTDLTYAPPFAPAIDPLLIAAQILDSKINKFVSSISPQELEKYLKEKKPCCVADLRAPDEFKLWHIENAKNVTLEDLQKNALSNNPEKLLIYCDNGMESYIEALRLRALGVKNVSFVDGGVDFLKGMQHWKKEK